MADVLSDPRPSAGDDPDRVPPVATGAPLVLAALCAGAGIVHLAMVPAHAGGDSWLDPVAFVVAGWAQLALAVALVLGRGGRGVLVAAAAVNAAFVGVWWWSRTAGLPVGSHAGTAEDVSLVDGTVAALEVAAVVLAVALAAAPTRWRSGTVGPAMASVAVLALATAAVVSPDAAGHGGVDHHDGAPHDAALAGAAAAGGHAHAAGSSASDTDHRAEMAAIDRRRCDLGFNPRSYWRTARAMGVDTYAGGEMAPHGTTDPVELAAGDPYGGRGSPGLDRLVEATSLAAGGEVAAAGLITALSDASERDQRAWTRWMRATGAAGAGHDHGGGSAAPDDNGGHGGHAGPQPWVAMVDQGDCVRLAQELETARDTALRFPTAADALAAGYVRTTPYVPGIAAHYMKFDLVDGEFDVEEPEMVLYDGNEPDARVVGLSYYLLQSGDAEPTQGFSGPNDHFHRHVGLCSAPGRGVIGDSTTTAEECAALGGRKSDGSRGWMSHAWVVPGCESPWGVFSGASPLLEQDLMAASGGEGGCAGSGVRDRYDLRPGGRARAVPGEQAGD